MTTRTIFLEITNGGHREAVELWPDEPGFDEQMRELGYQRIPGTIAEAVEAASNGVNGRAAYLPGALAELGPGARVDEQATAAHVIVQPAILQPCPTHPNGADPICVDCRRWERRAEAKGGKMPSERIAEIAADGRAMCALAAVKSDEQDIRLHAIGLYLDERLGAG
jgi:hypothetical protein